MHRCVYSIVHQDDMMDLKVMMETTLGHLVTRYDHQGVQVCILLCVKEDSCCSMCCLVVSVKEGSCSICCLM